MANSTAKTRMRCVLGNATTTEVNAGKIIVTGEGARQIVIVGGWLRALGGNATTNTSVNISDTTGTPVVGVACARAQLTEDAVLPFSDTTGITKTTYGSPFAAGKGLQIKNAGSAMTVATSVDYCVFYLVI